MGKLQFNTTYDTTLTKKDGTETPVTVTVNKDCIIIRNTKGGIVGKGANMKEIRETFNIGILVKHTIHTTTTNTVLDTVNEGVTVNA